MTINTSLTTSGNSVAVRLPKALLAMSGLGKNVTLEAKAGKIIISKAIDPRSDWARQIEEDIAKNGPYTNIVDEYGDMAKENAATMGDGLEDLPW